MYLVTSCDSALMIEDLVVANGAVGCSFSQRILWGLLKCAVAIAFMHAGPWMTPGESLGVVHTLRSLMLLCGLPFAILVCFMCVSLWRTVQYEFGYRDWNAGFKVHIFDFGVTVYSVEAEQCEL